MHMTGSVYLLSYCTFTWYWRQCLHKGSNASSIWTLAVDEERMRPGHWSGSGLCVPFSDLIPTVGWHEGHRARKIIPFHYSPQVRVEKEDPRVNWLTQVHLGKTAIKYTGSSGSHLVS